MDDASPGSGPPSPGDDGGFGQWRMLTAGAYVRFQDQLFAEQPNFPGLTNFDAAHRAKEAQGTMAWKWGAAGELSEAINLANSWGMRLHEWAAWNRTVDAYTDLDDQLALVSHFLEPLVSWCLLQPSSLSDRVALIAESLMHQANQRRTPSTPDTLKQVMTDWYAWYQRLVDEDPQHRVGAVRGALLSARSHPGSAGGGAGFRACRGTAVPTARTT